MSARPTWLGQRPLESAILWYRRRLSGRGPLRNVTCTFGRCESCSAYGLRIVRHHGHSLVHALRLILGRIQRCRTSSVYRNGNALLWGPDYDRLEQVDPAAIAEHERPPTRRALLRAAIALARYRREHRVFRSLVQRLRSLARGAKKSEVLPLRNGRRLLSLVRQRWLRQLAAPVGLGLLALWLPLPLWLSLPIGAIGLGLMMLSTVDFWEQHRRFTQQLRAGQFALS